MCWEADVPKSSPFSFRFYSWLVFIGGGLRTFLHCVTPISQTVLLPLRHQAKQATSQRLSLIPNSNHAAYCNSCSSTWVGIIEVRLATCFAYEPNRQRRAFGFKQCPPFAATLHAQNSATTYTCKAIVCVLPSNWLWDVGMKRLSFQQQCKVSI